MQVKQTDKAGRPDIDRFEAVMDREDRERGFFVGFGFSADARSEADAFWKRTKREITLLTVREILDEEHVQKVQGRPQERTEPTPRTMAHARIPRSARAPTTFPLIRSCLSMYNSPSAGVGADERRRGC